MPNLFPQVATAVEMPEATASETKFPRCVAFDFEAPEFVLSPTGRQYRLDETDSWVEWAVKALATPRYQHLIYSDNYGSELHTLLGKSYPHEVAESEIRRMVKECLLADARTEKVDQFSFQWIDDGVLFVCRMTNIRGQSKHIAGKVVL